MLLIVGLSYVYVLVENFIPIIYANVFIVVGYGIAISMMAKIVMYFGKFRSKRAAIIITLVLGVFANYTAWLAHVAYLWNDFNPSFSSYLDLLTSIEAPMALAYTLGDLYEFGTWGIGYSPDSNLTGPILGIVWLAELVGLTLYPAYIVSKKILPPFSEEADDFYDQYILDDMFKATYIISKVEDGLANNPVAFLESMAGAARYPCTRTIVYSLPRESTAYVAMYSVRLNQKKKEEVTPLGGPVRITSATAREILAHFDHHVDKVDALLN